MRMRDVPEEYRQHRYLSAGESARFLDLRHASKEDRSTVSQVPQGIESTRSAAAIGKRLLYLILQHSELFLPEVTAAWEATERRLLAAHPNVIATAETLLAAGKPDLAEEYLTYYCRTELLHALELMEILARSLEARTRTLFGISADADPKSPKQIW
jgi:hypothetical protein